MKRLAALVLAVPAALALLYIHTFGVNGAHWDHLATAELFDRFYTGTLTLEYLFRPHLEHIKFFPRIVALALGLATRFDNLAEMYLQWALLAATAGLLVWSVRRTSDAAPTSLLPLLPLPILLFNLRQHESMLMGDGMITYLSIAGTTTAVCLVSVSRSRGALAGAVAAALVASFSHASALLLWPLVALMIVIAGPLRITPAGALSRRAALLWWLAAAAPVIVLYAVRWSGVEGSVQHAVRHPLGALEYVVATAGAPFESSWRWQRRFGAVLVLLEAVTLVVAARRARAGLRVPLGVWLVAFAIGCRVMMAAGRAIGAAGHDVPSRYTAFMVVGNAGVYAATLEWASGRRVAYRTLFAAVALCLAVGTGRGYLEGWRAGPGERDMRLRIVQLLETTSLQDDATIERWLYPNAAHARGYARSLAHWRLNVFAAPRPDPSALARSAGLELSLDHVNGDYVAPGATVELRPVDLLQLSGWAFETRGHRLFERAYVRVNDGLRIPAAYGIYRPDVARIHEGVAETSGFGATFSAAALPPGVHAITMEFVTADGFRIIQTPVLFRAVVR
jgi:hypothetical protein